VLDDETVQPESLSLWLNKPVIQKTGKLANEGCNLEEILALARGE